MLKKLIGTIVIAVMLLGTIGLFGCDLSDLAKYKIEACAEIEVYAIDKGQDNYTAENWQLILQAVKDGKSAVKAATDKTGVDKAVEAAKWEIDWMVGTKLLPGLGSFDWQAAAKRLGHG